MRSAARFTGRFRWQMGILSATSKGPRSFLILIFSLYVSVFREKRDTNGLKRQPLVVYVITLVNKSMCYIPNFSV